MEIKEFNLNVPWGVIAVKAWGNSDDKPVLAVHGRQDNAGSYDRLIPLLPKCFYYVCIDLPGHGKSSHYPIGMIPDFYDLLHSVKRVVDMLEWNEFIFMGHSLAARLGLHFAAIYPEQISKLIMLDAIDSENIPPDMYKYWFKIHHQEFMRVENLIMYGTPPKYTYEQLVDLYKRNRGLSEKAVHPLLKRAIVQNSDGTLNLGMDQRIKQLQWPAMDNNYRMKALVHKKAFPHLMIFASESVDAGLKKQHARLLNALRKNKLFEEHVVKGNHDVHNDNPTAVAPIIEKFLLRLNHRL
ncbi:serine hydrolase-like protein 2 [Ctenocephalides felis]|uniref:serine hydrolase-like protein 2 n=1 Tax=Ctenocephalides felis TaxID=7515 RepID=UPI000E6E2E3A|nr:serine hydrolase-like protein 2 [Ctenocephalides felis]